MHVSRCVSARLLLLVGWVAAMAGWPSTASDAATFKRLTLDSHVVKVETSRGQTLRLAVSAFKDISDGAHSRATVTLSLSTGKPTSFGETHNWSFQVPRSTFGYHRHTGAGHVDTGSAMGDFGSVDLSFTKTEREFETCDLGGSLTTFTGTLRGSVHFRSSSSWGRVNEGHVRFTVPNTVVIDTGCEESEEEEDETCHEAISWVGPGAMIPGGVTTESGNVFLAGGPARPRITGTRTVSLSAPTGATRTDYLVAVSPAPQDNGDSLTISTTAGTAVSGSATITGGQPSQTATEVCEDAATGVDKQQTRSGYFGASWTSPSDDLLTFNFAAAADFAAPAGGSATWSHSSFS